jgi:NADH-quinone oxidoreductase subunit N
VVAFYLYLRVIVAMYMDEAEGPLVADTAPVRWVLGLSVAATLLLGVLPGPLLDLAGRALPL